jgi:hypothetical protein
MGKADRKLQRAQAALAASYADAIRPHRLHLAGMSASDARAAHDAAVAAARRVADREGGAGWLARAGLDDETLSTSLWDEHVAPLRATS